MRPSYAGLAAITLIALIGLVPTSASAQMASLPTPRTFKLLEGQRASSGPTSPAQASPPPVRWNPSWHKIRWWQYPLSVSLLGFGFLSRFALPDPEPNWPDAADVELEILDWIAVRDDPWRENLLRVTDLTFYGAMAYRAVDSIAVPGWVHQNWDVAWQMSWIDLQAFGLVAAVVWGSQLYVGRVRPTARHCDDPERRGHICDPESKEYARSFIAGHPATAIAAAGLTCLHHSRMPLYGGGVADKLACGATIGNAVVSSVTRMMVEHHYPSDVLFGAVLGLTAGWILPTTLHYGWGDEQVDPAETARLPDPDQDRMRPVFGVAPMMVEDRPGLMLMGRF